LILRPEYKQIQRVTKFPLHNEFNNNLLNFSTLITIPRGRKATGSGNTTELQWTDPMEAVLFNAFLEQHNRGKSADMGWKSEVSSGPKSFQNNSIAFSFQHRPSCLQLPLGGDVPIPNSPTPGEERKQAQSCWSHR
jgi:hypothetical protein